MFELPYGPIRRDVGYLYQGIIQRRNDFSFYFFNLRKMSLEVVSFLCLVAATFILEQSALVSCNRVSSVIQSIKHLNFVANSSSKSASGNDSAEDLTRSARGDLTRSAHGDFYKLTNSDVFDMDEDVVGKALHLVSPNEKSNVFNSDRINKGFSDKFRDADELRASDGLVLVPSCYEEIEPGEGEIDDYEEDEEDDEEEDDNYEDSEYYDLETEFGREYGNFATVKNSNENNKSYFQHLMKTEPHLLEKMKGSLTDRMTKPGQGEPLFLTPYAYASNYREGRNLAAVKPFAGNVKSYAGYLTVDKRFHSNLFFWYFPCERSDAEKRPLLLWLQGGPGGSSLFALFYENGPYKFVHGKIHTCKYSWTKEYNVIYIDNPVGTGFSFTTHQGLARNQTIIGQHLYEALNQFLHLFPELRDNDFYITGESYAGKYIPAVAYEIHQRNVMSHIKINLKGLFIGNGMVDPISMMHYSQYLFHIGLLDEEQRDIVAKMEQKIKLYIRTKQWRRATNMFEDFFFNSRANRTRNNFLKMTGYHQHYNLNGLDFNTKDFNLFVKDVSVRERLHVGRMKFNDGAAVAHALLPDIMKSVIDKVNVLVENYRTVFYYGQLDIICPYSVSVPFFNNIQFRGAYDYYKAKRQIWTCKRQDDVVGYIKEAHNLAVVLIRNAGHMVPHDQPRFMMDLLKKYIK